MASQHSCSDLPCLFLSADSMAFYFLFFLEILEWYNAEQAFQSVGLGCRKCLLL